MIKLKQAVIVEGKYDKITLENIVDATIIATDGFRIFKNDEKRNLIRLLAQKHGIIVITDSDSAGGVIRSHLKQICPDGTITNVYVPQLKGKEKRKTTPSKQGLLGVEGLDKQIIIDALARSGITGDESTGKHAKQITKTDLFTLGFSGSKNSAVKREQFAQRFKIPTKMSCNAFLDCINAVFEYEEFFTAVKLWQQEEDKR